LNIFLDTPANGIFQESCNYYASTASRKEKKRVGIHIHNYTEKKNNYINNLAIIEIDVWIKIQDLFRT